MTLLALAALVLSPLALLLAAPFALAHALVLPVLEGFVAQLLLLARHVLQVLHGLVHLLSEGIRHAAVGLSHLKVFQDAAQLVEQALGFRHVAPTHGILHLLEHAVQVVLRDHPVGRALVLGLILPTAGSVASAAANSRRNLSMA